MRNRIQTAARRAGRDPASVLLIAVTKYASLAWTRELVTLGCDQLGESRPQQLWEKAAKLSGVAWHLIGPLQTNKVAKTLRYVHCIHACDSARLYQCLVTEARKLGKPIKVYLEVNISGDADKHGWTSNGLRDFLQMEEAAPEISVLGLMGMSGLESSDERKREEFRQLASLRMELEDLAVRRGFGRFDQLSMGMTDDFEIAIEEGATMVRIGSALWEGIALTS